MADNKLIIEILTDDKGTAKKATLKQKDLQKQVKKTGDQYKKTGDQAKDYNKKEKALYQSNLSTAKGFSKMKETMGSGSSGLVGAYATLAANVFAATAAFNALRGAAQVQTLIEGFTFLGNAAGQSSMQIAQGIREITDGAVSLEVALRSSAIALTSGFNTNQIAELAEVAKNASIALGRNMADSIDRLFRGVAKLEPEILDELGIMVRLDTAVNKYAAQLGKSVTALTDFERRQAFLNETLTQGALKYGDLSGRIDPNPYDKLASAFADLTEKGLNLINNFMTPLLTLLSTNSGALVGGLILFGSTILTTMIPALGQFAQKQAQVAVTAREMADEQARAGKVAAQNAKIDFIRGGGSAALTTKGGEFARVADLKKDLKRGKADAQSFNKALQQVQNTRKRTATIAKKNGTANSAAHKQRMAELEALEAQILDIQMKEQQRAGSSGASALAAGQATGQEGVSQSMMLIGGSGAVGGFKEAFKGLDEFRTKQKEGHKEWKKSLGKSGLFKRWGKSVSLGFGTASVAARLFGAALMNAIPIIGQILFFGGLLISFFAKFKGEASESEKAFKKLSETVDTATEKFEQLAETNKLLSETLDGLEDDIRDTAIAATALKNQIVVTAGVAKEARINFENLADAIDDEKITGFQRTLANISNGIKNLGQNIRDFVVNRIKEMLGFLDKVVEKLADLGIIAPKVLKMASEATVDYFTDDKPLTRAEKFKAGIKLLGEEIEELKDADDLMAKALKGFDPAAQFKLLEAAVSDSGDQMLTFEQASEIVNKQFRMITKGVEETSENIQGLSVNIQEVGKVFNKNLDSILKRNAFDKIADTVGTLNASLVQMSKEKTLLTDQDILNQLALASETAGVDLKTFGISLESVRTALQEGGEPLEKLETDLRDLAEKTRTNVQDQKDLKESLKSTIEEFKNTKALDEFTAKLENFKKFGKVEIGVKDQFTLQIQAAESAKKLAEDTAKIKKDQVDAEFALELFKIQVFKATAKTQDQADELTRIENQIEAFKTLRKGRIDDQKEAEINAAKLNKLSAIQGAGSTGTIGERASVVGTALGIEDEEADLTVAKIQAVENAMQPMIENLKALGPEGEAVATAFTGIMTIASAFQIAGDKGMDTADRIAAVGQMVSAVSAIMQANSKAQIAEVEAQIKAEKARDGKSKESLAKIQGFEKKKEAMARKAFEQNKKMQIASAIISTASGVVGALGDPSVPITFGRMALAVMIGALGAAQIAIIRKQQFQGGSSDSGPSVPSTLEVGKRSNKVDVSKGATGGEVGFLRGAKGIGTNANDFVGAAAGMKRGYASGGEIMVGERGPEVITPVTPLQVTPNDKIGGTTNVNFSINAVDAAGVEELLTAQRGNIIGMIREAANEHGEEFMEEVNTGAY
jgi:hypothetical protein